MPRLPIPLLVGAMLSALIPCTGLAQHQASGLPDGEGKTLVESMCTACHPTTQITRSSGYTLAGWKELTGTMLDLSRSPETQDKLLQYLASQLRPFSQVYRFQLDEEHQVPVCEVYRSGKYLASLQLLLSIL